MKKIRRHQVKSKWYYIFWGIATVSVVAGQIYVGTGFRQMASSLSEGADLFSDYIKSIPTYEGSSLLPR